MKRRRNKLGHPGHPRPGPAALIAALILIAAITAPAFAESAGDTDAGRYRDCMEMARSDPAEGFETALAWQDAGGGDPARHCAAVALIELGHYGEAATRLERLAEGLQPENLEQRIPLLAQAAQAWQLQGELERAYAVQTAALALAPGDADLLIDRSVTLAAAENYRDALEDLSLALQIDPNRAEALVYRATARRFLGDDTAALRDVERALQLDPDHPDGLLERGILRRLSGDPAGARADWLRIANLFPDTAVAAAAQANLEKLDVTVE